MTRLKLMFKHMLGLCIRHNWKRYGSHTKVDDITNEVVFHEETYKCYSCGNTKIVKTK